MKRTVYKVIYVIIGVLGFATYFHADPPSWFVGWFMFMIGVVGFGLERAAEDMEKRERK